MKKIMKIIVYTGVIISLIPIITMFCINLRQNKIETDRNFYGKEITEGQLKVVQNSYQKYECNIKYFVIKKDIGQLKYYYNDKNHMKFETNEKSYNKYIKGADIFFCIQTKMSNQLSFQSWKINSYVYWKQNLFDAKKIFGSRIKNSEKSCGSKES